LMAWPHGLQHESRGTRTYPTGDFTSTKSIKIMKACSFGGSLFHPAHLWLMLRLMSRLHIPDPCIFCPRTTISQETRALRSQNHWKTRGGVNKVWF
jgi:hypothetical protein